MTPFERAERNEIGNTRLKAWRTTGQIRDFQPAKPPTFEQRHRAHM